MKTFPRSFFPQNNRSRAQTPYARFPLRPKGTICPARRGPRNAAGPTRAKITIKSGNIYLGFADRFTGSVILLGGRADVRSALESIIDFFRNELNFTVCDITER